MEMSKKSDAYQKLLAKLDGVDMGTGGFWKPTVGMSTIRILPPIGEMDYFFVEVGQHYVGSSFMCPAICSDGEDPCPLCEVNEALYRAGEKEAADKFRVRRSFWVNAIVRGQEANGPVIFTPGVTIFRTLASFISDPDYGDITDEEDGFDIRIERQGEGLKTRYETRAVRSPTPLGSDEEIEEWLDDAKDLTELITSKMLSYEDLMEQTGVDAFLEEGDLDSVLEGVEEDAEEPSATDRIEKRMARRSRGKPRGRRSPRGR